MYLHTLHLLVMFFLMATGLGGIASLAAVRPAMAQSGACGQNPNPPNPSDPSVRVTAPASGARVSSPITISGQARVFEATVSFSLRNSSGGTIASGFATAEQGAPALAPFTGTLPFSVASETPACLWVYEESAADGSPRNVVQTPLTLLPASGGGSTTGQWFNAPPAGSSATVTCPAAGQWLLLYWNGPSIAIDQAARACTSSDRIWASREGRWLGFAPTSPNASDTWNVSTGEAHFMHGAPSPGGQPSTGASLTGTVTYRERIGLTDAAVVTVRLVEGPATGGSPVVVAEQVINTGGRQVPISFSIGYDPARIDPAKAYFVEATIADRGQVIFRSTDPFPVITMGAPTTVEVLVRSAG